MATIRDVAEKAGVSIATVSNYLNGTKPVSPASAQKISQAVQELQYTANAAAKGLRAQKSHEIGVILPNFDDPYYVQIFQGIEKAFSGSSYFLSIAFSYDSPAQETQKAEAFLSRQVCGLILVSCKPDAWKYYYDNFISKGRPIVMVDRRIQALDADYVLVDNYFSVRRITADLLRQGYRQLQLISGPDSFTCEDSCIRAFLDAHVHAGVTPEDQQMIQLPLTKEQGFSQTIKLLRHRQPDAIITTSSLVASGVIEGLHLLGFREQQIPVITLGEEHWNTFTQTQASYSTARPAIKLGSTAANLLQGQLTTPLRDTEQVTLKDTGLCEGIRFLNTEKVLPSRTGEDPLRILMLDSPAVHDFQGLIKNFEHRSGIKTQVRFLSHSAMFDEIQSGSGGYDVMMFDIPWLSVLAGSGVLEDLSGDLDQIDTDQFFPNSLTHFGAFRDGIYGIPFISTPQMLYYRKDLFEDPNLRAEYGRLYGASLRPPISMKEYNAVAAFFTTQTGAVDYGVSVAAAYNECFAPELYFRLHAFQSKVFDGEGKVVFDNPNTLKAYINFHRTLRFAKPNFLEATDTSIVEDFLRGDTAMLITYPAFLPNDTHLRKNASIGQSLVPGRRPLLGGWSFGIRKNIPRRADALEFLRWTCNKSIGNYFTIMGGQSAIASTYTNDEMLKLYPWLLQYYKAYPYTEPEYSPVLPNGQPMPVKEVDGILCKWAYRCLMGSMEITDAIAATHRELEEKLQDWLK